MNFNKQKFLLRNLIELKKSLGIIGYKTYVKGEFLINLE